MNHRPNSIALVDLSCLFKKNFMAMPGAGPMAAADKTLAELADVRQCVEHVILCLDSPPYERRRAIFAEYKAQRQPITDIEREQKKFLYRECRRLGYQMAKVQGEEADDVVATLARIYGEWCPDVRLVGADKDLAQCVTANVRQVVPPNGTRPGELRGPERVLEKYGVTPAQIPLYLALTGDKSDNIPGVPGIGQVKAVRLISEHKTFFDLGEAAALRPPSGDWKALKEHWSTLEMCLALTTLRTNLPLDAEALLAPLAAAPVANLDGSLDAGAFDTALESFEPEPAAPAAPAPAKPIIGADPNAGQFLRDFNERQQRARQSDVAAARAHENEQEREERAHENEQEREERWRREMREEMQAGTSGIPGLSDVGRKMVDIANRARTEETRAAQPPPANDQLPPSATRPAVSEAEWDPISRAPGATGAQPPLPPKPQQPKEPPKEERVKNYGSVTHDLQPLDLQSAEIIAKAVCASQLYPQFRNTSAVLMVIMRGKELGVKVTTALAGFNALGNKLVATADMIRSLATRSDKCKYLRRIHADDTYAEWETWHVDHPEPTRFKYTIEQARRAGLTGGNWNKIPMEMLSKTAASKLARECYPAETLGLYCPEEMGAIDSFDEEAA